MDDTLATSQVFLEKARKAEQAQEYHEAARLAKKADRIHHTKDARNMANRMDEYTKKPPQQKHTKQNTTNTNTTSANTNATDTHHRANTKATQKDEKTQPTREFSTEQMTLVKKLKIHITKKEYYKILDIPIDVPQDKIKKAYLKRALLFHPDKNAGKIQIQCPPSSLIKSSCYDSRLIS
jgi:hypothetical protein